MIQNWNKTTETIIGVSIDVHRERGLLLNFNVTELRRGIRRLVNNFKEKRNHGDRRKSRLTAENAEKIREKMGK